MKKPWQSKTLWFNALVALLALVIPGMAELTVQYPVVVVVLQALVNVLLRFITKDKVSVESPGLKCFIGFLTIFLVGAASCNPLVEDSSAAALESGQATMVLGGCRRPMGMGYEVCQVTRGTKLPHVQFGFMNPAEWALSDCRGSIWKTGSTDKAATVDVDLTELQDAIDLSRFCWLRLEAVEFYPDPKSEGQMQKIAMAGGFLVEALAPGYMPVPSEDMVAWCYEVRRTTQGRTTVKRCK